MSETLLKSHSQLYPHKRRQTHPNPSGTLLLAGARDPTPPTGLPDGKSCLLGLPDELLNHIIRLAVQPKEWYHTVDGVTVRRVALVCHRFCRISRPVLYRKIEIPDLDGTSRQLRKLHRSLREDQSLGLFCRDLTVNISDSSGASQSKVDAEFRLLNELSAWLTSVERLHIHGGFSSNNEPTWAFIERCSQHMRRLKQLQLGREAWGLYLQPALERMDFPQLEMLDISGISSSETGSVRLESKKHRTATFTSIKLSDYEERPEATSQLIAWPAKLVDFAFGSYYNNPHYADLPMFHAMLSLHKETLRSISIGYLATSSCGKLFRACDFPNLQSLCLSRWSMSDRLESPTSDAHMLLGPKLEHFEWDFSINDLQSESWDDLGECEARWVRGLVGEAIHQQAALRTIRITFYPEEYWGDAEESYKWAALEETYHVARGGNIALTCSRPVLTKGAWLEYVRGLAVRRDMDMASHAVRDAFYAYADTFESDDSWDEDSSSDGDTGA